MEEDNIIIDDCEVSEEQPDVAIETTIEVIEVEDVETVYIDTDDAFSALGEPNEQLRHQLLTGRDTSDQHPIIAITGLREELDDIESLKTVYSNGKQLADYYEWEDGNPLGENRAGYFVSICNDIRSVQICEGANIFGVIVDNAAFVGGQDGITRDYDYGLVLYSGVADVRCELDVEVGSYVISNDYGVAKKSESGYGYKVVAINNKNGIKHATILLNSTANQMDTLGESVNEISERMDDAETNIVTAINVANEAYNKANESVGISEEALQNALGAVGKVNDSLENVNKIQETVLFINEQAVQAKAIAESAAVSAESIRDEAIKKANDALTSVNELHTEFESTTDQMQADLDNTFLGLQKVEENITSTKNDLQKNIDDTVDELKKLEEDLEPLATWPEGSGVDRATALAGFIARADEDSATLASVTKFEGEFGEAITGFVQEATKDNATVKAIASYQQKDENGNPYGPSGASVLMGQVDANKASIDLLSSLEGDGFTGLAGLTAQVNKNTSSVSTLASHVVGEFENVDDWVEDGKDVTKVYYVKNRRLYYYYSDKDKKWNNTDKAYEAGLTGSIAGVQSVADDNKAQLDAMVEYDKDGKSALAGLTAYVDENSSNIGILANYSNDDSGRSGIAGLVADVDENTSALSMVAEHSFTKDDGTVVTGLAGLQAHVNDNTSKVSLVSNRVAGRYVVLEIWDDTDKNTETIYYAKDTKFYWYYNNGWASTTDAYTAGLPSLIAGIQVETDDHSSKINNLTSWQGETTESMARIEQKADENGASINSIVASVDKYSVGEYSQAYGLTREQASSILKEGTIYIPMGDSHSETYGDLTQSFSPGYYYEWNGTQWDESSSNAVIFSAEKPVGSAYQYWYINSNTAPAEYEPYALYIYEAEKWKKVNILSGNTSNRITSMISQEVNKISLAVTNAQGSIAGLDERLTEEESQTTLLNQWKTDTNTNIATLQSKAYENGSSISQIVSNIGSDGTVNAASIVAAVNGSDSEVVINANHIKFEGFVSFATKNEVSNVKNSAVINTKVEYALSSSSSEFIAVSGTDGQWSTTAPVWRDGAYMWQKTTITKGNNSSTSTQTCIQGADGAQGYSIVASVSRPSFVEEQWIEFGTVGHTEWWNDTESIRNGCRIGDIFTIVGTATDTGNAHVLYYRSLNDDGILYGTCLSHSVANAGKNGATGANGVSVTSVEVEYAISKNNTTAPTSGWTTNLMSLTWTPSHYIWSREVITYSNGQQVPTTAQVDKALSVVAGWCVSNDKTYINGAKIYTGSITSEQLNTNAIKSLNYVAGSTGSKLDLADGTFDSKNFKIANDGTITATSGAIGTKTPLRIGENGIIGSSNIEELVGQDSALFYGSAKEWYDAKYGSGQYDALDSMLKPLINIGYKTAYAAALTVSYVALPSINLSVCRQGAVMSQSVLSGLGIRISEDSSSLVLSSDGIIFRASDTLLGRLGFSAINTPVFYHTENGEQKLIHEGNISNYSIPIYPQSSYNLNTCYDAGLYMFSMGSGHPSGSYYGCLLSLPYRKATGNTTPDFGTQIFMPNGDDSTKPNSLFYRTSKGSTWNDWQEVATKSYVSSSYLPLSGGTISGNLAINGTFTLPNDVALQAKNGENPKEIMKFSSTRNLVIGYGLYGAETHWAYGAVSLYCSAGMLSFEIDPNGYSAMRLRPGVDDACQLGAPNQYWHTVYTERIKLTDQTGISDRRLKKNIVALSDIHSKLFDRLQPVQYEFINHVDRIHYGLIAQDVEDSMIELGIGVDDLGLVRHEYYIDETTGELLDEYGLGYNNLIAMLIHEVQKLKKEIKILKGE